jgi:hypothetical protein
VLGEIGRRNNSKHSPLLVTPDHPIYRRFGPNEMLRACRECLVLGPGTAEVDGQTLDIILDGGEVETQGLFHPERVLDQCEPLLLALVAIDEPQEERNENHEQPHDEGGQERNIVPPAPPLTPVAGRYALNRGRCRRSRFFQNKGHGRSRNPLIFQSLLAVLLNYGFPQ